MGLLFRQMLISGNGWTMKLVCKKLPGVDETLRFISPYFMLPHVRKYVDDVLYTPWGFYNLFLKIKFGQIRVYGTFVMSDPVQFAGFGFGTRHGNWFETHVVFDRGYPAAECLELCKKEMAEDYRKEGYSIEYAAGFIPDFNRAAQRMLKRMGGVDHGIDETRILLKNGKSFPCREFRVKI